MKIRRAGLLGMMSMLCVVLELNGCSSESGPQRYRLSGNVTYDGKPVPSGRIALSPDGSSVGAGYAPITEGRYDTQIDGRGHLGGPHTITITGSDLELIDPKVPDLGTRPLFPNYEIKLDLHHGAEKRDFEVPVTK
ncbi:hypothetical protein SH661x_002120 [Planctomicrobium sp. SH661]|uniref:hypothetical protein n=1 Tax=Planctomicrobium sp. SH661 TaxID=3448124 RepID=UPI003F5B1638